MLQRTDFGYFGTMTPVHVVCLFEACSRNFIYEKKCKPKGKINLNVPMTTVTGHLKLSAIIFYCNPLFSQDLQTIMPNRSSTIKEFHENRISNYTLMIRFLLFKVTEQDIASHFSLKGEEKCKKIFILLK